MVQHATVGVKVELCLTENILEYNLTSYLECFMYGVFGIDL